MDNDDERQLRFLKKELTFHERYGRQLNMEKEYYDFLDYLTENIENILDKEDLSIALASHLNSHFEMGYNEALSIVSEWFQIKRSN
jgi:hypothetical protein